MKNIQSLLVTVALLLAIPTLIAASAEQNWEKHCVKCHGKDGSGDTKMGKKLGVKDYTDPDVQSAMSDEDMIRAIKEGVTENGKVQMKGFGDVLTDEEVTGLVKHIRELCK